MNVNIQYFMAVNNKKKVVNPPDGFPSRIEMSSYLPSSMSEGVALALAMGEYNRAKGLVLPRGVLFEKAP
jgi:hypothetical protein